MIFNGIKGAIFDFDGTLADSLGVWSDIDVKFMKKRGFEVPDGYFMKVAAMNFIQAAEYTIELLDLKETPEEIIREWYDMAKQEYAENVLLKPGAKEFVKLLKDAGIKTAVATAGETEIFVPALENNGAEELFDTYAVTREVSRGKGFPDVYDLAAKRLGLMPGECVVFEDIAAGITGAKNGGYIAVGIYEERSAHEEEFIKSQADYYAEDFYQLIGLYNKETQTK